MMELLREGNGSVNPERDTHNETEAETKTRANGEGRKRKAQPRPVVRTYREPRPPIWGRTEVQTLVG